MLGSVQQMLSCVYSMNVCVCLLKIWLCVPNENTSSILWTVKRFDGKESSCKGSVRFSILCVRFSVFCVQFWESRYCFEKRVLTIVKNCNISLIHLQCCTELYNLTYDFFLLNVYSSEYEIIKQYKEMRKMAKPPNKLLKHTAKTLQTGWVCKNNV